MNKKENLYKTEKQYIQNRLYSALRPDIVSSKNEEIKKGYYVVPKVVK